MRQNTRVFSFPKLGNENIFSGFVCSALREVDMKSRIKSLFVALLAVAALVCAAASLLACAPSSQGSDKTVTVTLVGETLEETAVQAKPGDPLPVLELEDRDFEGYWTDSSYAVRYEGTTVPEQPIKLYYKANLQYYTLVLDFGSNGSLSLELRRGVNEKPPDTSPPETDAGGPADTKDGTAEYLVGDTVKKKKKKGETAVLYARYEVKDVGDYTIENGTVVRYNGSNTALTLPLGATKVAAGAFADNPRSAEVLSLTVPETYTSLECGAFEGLTGLESLTVPFIGGSRMSNRFLAYVLGAEAYTDNTYSFAGYSDGTSLYLGDEHYENQVLPLTLKTVRVTESVRDIAEGAFYSAYALQNLVLDHPEDLRTIGASAFENCLSFGYDSSLGISISPFWLRYVTSIGDAAFKSYTGNTESSVKVIYPYGPDSPEETAELITYEYPFNNLVTIPRLQNVTEIGEEAFYYAAALGDLSFGDQLRSVGARAFMFALSLGELRFPDSVQTIGDFAFYVSGVLSVEFGTGIRSIGTHAFGECPNLSEAVFAGSEPPELRGGQSFSNSLVAAGDNSYNIQFSEFYMYVPAEAADAYLGAVGWDEYDRYIYAADPAEETAYWSLDGTSWDAKFEFLNGRVYVTDPQQAFISEIDWANYGEMTYGLTCGTYYPMMYEVLSAEEYAATAAGTGSLGHAKPLYENQYILHLWHPELLDYDGSVLQDLYFLVSELPYEAGSGRKLVPVLEQIGMAGLEYGSVRTEGSYVVVLNEYGVPQVGRVVRDGAFYTVDFLADPEGTYTARMEAGDGYYSFTYYDRNFDVIDVRTYVQLDDTGYSWDAPIYEKSEDFILFNTEPTYNDGNQLYLDGLGGAVLTLEEGEAKYTASVRQDGALAFGEEGYTVTLYDLKNSAGSAVEGTATAVFRDHLAGQYNRIDISFGSYTYTILNVTFNGYWYRHSYQALADVEIHLPEYSDDVTDDLWRYKSLSTCTVDTSLILYRVSTDDLATVAAAYYREYRGEELISFGTVEYGADGAFVLVSDDGVRRVAQTLDNRGSFEIEASEGGTAKVYTRYDDSEDTTLVSAEDFYGYSIYYYTVKMDGYGNMYILDEHEDGVLDMYLGTYDDYNSFSSGGSDFYELKFTGHLLDANGDPVGDEVTWWILYDFGTLAAWSDDETDAQWYGSIAAIYTDHADKTLTIVDAFGFKLFDLTIDVYGNTGYVQYSYTLDRNGNPTYSVTETSDVAMFVSVTDSAGDVQYVIAFDSAGYAMYSARPTADDPDVYTIVYDGGLYSPVNTVSGFTVDTDRMESLPAGGVSFGTLD